MHPPSLTYLPARTARLSAGPGCPFETAQCSGLTGPIVRLMLTARAPLESTPDLARVVHRRGGFQSNTLHQHSEEGQDMERGIGTSSAGRRGKGSVVLPRSRLALV